MKKTSLPTKELTSVFAKLNIQPIKILYIINQSTIGGGQRNVLWLIREFQKYSMFSIQIACASGGELWDSYQRLADAAYDVPLNFLTKPRRLFHLYKIIRKQKIQVVHTHGGIAGLWGRIAAIFAGAPVRVHTLHGIHYLNYSNPINRFVGIWVERILSYFTYKTIYVSPSNFTAGKKFRLSPIKKSILIRNAVEDPLSKKIRRISRQDLIGRSAKSISKNPVLTKEDSFLFGCIARFDPVKGHCYLIEAFNLLAEKYPQIYLVLVGSGPEEGKLLMQVREMGLEGRIIFLGNRSDVYSILYTLDVVVLPSLWEGLPLSLLEAMAAKSTIIASETVGIVDIITHQVNGLLTPPANPENLANTMEIIINDKKLREKLAANARKSFLKENTLKQMVEKNMEIYISGIKDAGER